MFVFYTGLGLLGWGLGVGVYLGAHTHAWSPFLLKAEQLPHPILKFVVFQSHQDPFDVGAFISNPVWYSRTACTHTEHSEDTAYGKHTAALARLQNNSLKLFGHESLSRPPLFLSFQTEVRQNWPNTDHWKAIPLVIDSPQGCKQRVVFVFFWLKLLNPISGFFVITPLEHFFHLNSVTHQPLCRIKTRAFCCRRSFIMYCHSNRDWMLWCVVVQVNQ